MPQLPADKASIPPELRSAPGDRSEVDLLLPVAAAICITLGWYVVMDYERAVMAVAPLVPALVERLRNVRLMMILLSIGGLGLAILAARDARRRRRAEKELRLAHAALGRQMARRTDALKSRTKALRESRLREQLKEREAEVAFAAGQVEAAGAYLHAVGNALTAFDLALLRLGRTLDGAERLDAAFVILLRFMEAGEWPQAIRQAAALRKAVLLRAVPRLAASAVALVEIKARMAGELERHRGEFERYGAARPYLQPICLDEEIAAVLDRMPRSAGSDPVVRDLAREVLVRNRKHPFLTGLTALVRQSLDAATGRVVVRLSREPEKRAVLSLEGVPEADAGEPAVAAFINFLNENNGAIRFESAASGHPSRLVVEIGNAP